MNEQVQFIQVTPEQIQNAIIEGVKTQLEELKKSLQPIQPTEYLTRNDVAQLLQINLSTLYNWTKKGVLNSYSISSRVYYRRDEVNNAIVKLNF